LREPHDVHYSSSLVEGTHESIITGKDISKESIRVKFEKWQNPDGHKTYKSAQKGKSFRVSTEVNGGSSAYFVVRLEKLET
jgi:hypothetical protein